MMFGAMDSRKMWGLVRYGREDRDHRDIEKRRESEGGYREEVSASAMEPVCPVSRAGREPRTSGKPLTLASLM